MNGDLENKLETAFASQIAAAVLEAYPTLSANSYNGQSSVERLFPCSVSEAQAGEETPINSGNCFVDVDVSVMTKLSPDTDEQTEASKLTEHRNHVKAVRDALSWDDLGSRLTAHVADLHVYDPVIRQGFSKPSIQGNVAISTATYRVFCVDGALT